MRNVSLVLILVILASFDSFAQENRFSIGIHTSTDYNYGGLFGSSLNYRISPKSQVGVEAFYNKGTTLDWKNPRWRLGLRHNWTLVHSKKFPALTTWYFSQFMDYGQDNLLYHRNNLDGRSGSTRNVEYLNMGLGIGRNFNLSENFSISAEIGFQHSLWNKSVSRNGNGEITYLREYSNAGGMRLQFGAIYRIPYKKKK